MVDIAKQMIQPTFLPDKRQTLSGFIFLAPLEEKAEYRHIVPSLKKERVIKCKSYKSIKAGAYRKAQKDQYWSS